MGMPVKLSDELVDAARREAASTDRSITGQIEHWVKIGRSVEKVLRHQDIQALKRAPTDLTLTAQMRHAVEAALGRAIAETDQRALAQRLKAGRTVYQNDPAGSGMLERIDAGGKRTLGRLVNRQFVPARPTRSRAR
jgi:hypothetical protein